jgi:hypothetical protein
MINAMLRHYYVKLTQIVIMLFQTHAVLIVFITNAAKNNALRSTCQNSITAATHTAHISAFHMSKFLHLSQALTSTNKLTL